MRGADTRCAVHALLIGTAAALAPAALHGQAEAVRYLNPPGLSRPTGYTHVTVAPAGRTVYVAGQVSLDSAGRVVGAGDFRAQTERVFANLELALKSAGASFADVVNGGGARGGLAHGRAQAPAGGL